VIPPASFSPAPGYDAFAPPLHAALARMHQGGGDRSALVVRPHRAPGAWRSTEGGRACGVQNRASIAHSHESAAATTSVLGIMSILCPPFTIVAGIRRRSRSTDRVGDSRSSCVCNRQVSRPAHRIGQMQTVVLPTKFN